jgi:hypothetical protein
MKLRLLLKALPLLVLLVVMALLPGQSRADLTRDWQERLARLKQAQREMMLSEPYAERREFAEHLRAWKKAHAKALQGGHVIPSGERVRRDPESPAATETRAARMARIARVASPAGTAALGPNSRVNDPSADLFTDTAQSEVSVAADGNNVVAAWNDGEGLNYFPYLDAQGYGYSTNGGVTWTDGGAPPAPGVGLVWFSDPVLTVNAKTHQFYFTALFVDPNDLNAGSNGVAVVKGSFSGGVLSWGTPVLAGSGLATTYLFDKEWMAADSTTGNVYVSYVRFFVGGDQVELVRSTDGGASFGVPTVLSSTQDRGYVQAPRVVIGPTGNVHVVWYAIGNATLSYWGRDYFRARTSTNSGTSYGSQVTVDSMFVDFGNGGPGFNRGNAFAFPGAAIDNTGGARRGRLYVSWNESVDFYNSSDLIGYRLPTIGESVDYGGTFGLAKQTTVGDLTRGRITTNDEDWFKFTGTKDSTIIVFCDSVTSSLQPELELRGPDGTQQLSFASGGTQQSILSVYTFPQTGTYYLRMHGAPGTAGAYILYTGYHRPMAAPQNDRARDHRDIFVKYTDTPAAAWPASTVRVNSEPSGFDDWLPEVAVGGNGKPYVAWIDFHDHSGAAFPGTGATIYLSRSEDGGATWAGGSPVSDVTTYWWNVASNIAPNQGDYIALFGAPNGVLAGWGDGRDGDPNVYFSNIDLAYTAIAVSLASATAVTGNASLVWQVADASGFSAVLERRGESGEWTALATLVADGTGRMTYDDAGVTAGRWGYRLRWSESGVTRTSEEAWVMVPSNAFALRFASPNPSTGPLHVSFTLADAAPATLELVDIGGRELARIDAGAWGAGTHVVDLAQGRRLPAGVYLVRLTQGTRHTVLRATIVR